MDSAKPCMANLDAEYPVLPGKPLYPAMEEIPITEPYFYDFIQGIFSTVYCAPKINIHNLLEYT